MGHLLCKNASILARPFYGRTVTLTPMSLMRDPGSCRNRAHTVRKCRAQSHTQLQRRQPSTPSPAASQPSARNRSGGGASKPWNQPSLSDVHPGLDSPPRWVPAEEAGSAKDWPVGPGSVGAESQQASCSPTRHTAVDSGCRPALGRFSQLILACSDLLWALNSGHSRCS